MYELCCSNSVITTSSPSAPSVSSVSRRSRTLAISYRLMGSPWIATRWLRWRPSRVPVRRGPFAVFWALPATTASSSPVMAVWLHHCQPSSSGRPSPGPMRQRRPSSSSRRRLCMLCCCSYPTSASVSLSIVMLQELDLAQYFIREMAPWLSSVEQWQLITNF